MIKKNEQYEAEIVDITNEGYGVAKIDGIPVFVNDTICGEIVELKIIKVAKSYGVGRVERRIKTSSSRIEPSCPHFKKCGGCSLQHMAYEEEKRIKQNYALQTLKRIGRINLDNVEVYPILGAKEIFHYRNKAEYPIRKGNNGCMIGFFKVKSHDVVEIEDCLLQPQIFKTIVSITKKFIDEYQISCYDEEEHKGLLRHLYIREGFVSKEIMVCLVINGKTLPHQEEWINRLTSAISTIKSIVLNHNEEKTNAILASSITTIYGSDTIKDILCGNEIEISPLSFYQINHDQTEVLYKRAKEFAELSGNEVLIDLYCGAGTIGLSMADKTKMLYGVEIIEEAIENAKRNAAYNHIDNCEFEAGDASILAKKLANRHITPDVIVVDPPRKGITEDVIQACNEMNPKRIVYVSCNVATLARDVEIFERTTNYKVTKIQMVDLFPRTNHVETVCLLSKLHEAKHHVNVKLDMDEMELTAAESKATYEEIKKYVAEHYEGMKVSNLYIAQVKAKYGIIERENYNLPKSGDAKQPQCPKDKEKAIEDALRYFQMK